MRALLALAILAVLGLGVLLWSRSEGTTSPLGPGAGPVQRSNSDELDQTWSDLDRRLEELAGSMDSRARVTPGTAAGGPQEKVTIPSHDELSGVVLGESEAPMSTATVSIWHSGDEGYGLLDLNFRSAEEPVATVETSSCVSGS